MMETPRSKAGLLGRNAIDMRGRLWGELRAVRQSMRRGWWFFEHVGAEHDEFQLDGGKVRKDEKAGVNPVCPVCSRKQAP